ncbi:MAG: hypothetical protein HY689_05400 [Chloroflexi bacterium]|nr:hypothetical protein [Chloroflexota bacterium]
MTEPRLERIAQEFWAAAGGPEPFPRRLEGAVLWALPLMVAKLPRLWVRDAEAWLRARGLPFCAGGPDRPLHGCLVAYGGSGCVLLDGTDPADEQRFSLAHEVAHFLLDYQEPRRRAVQRLGRSLLEVFDGRRPPTATERIDAILCQAPMGAHTHLMERRPDGVLGCGPVADAEAQADRLALELLAPDAEVERRVALSGRPVAFAAGRRHLVAALTTDFGLPQAVAASYGAGLARAWWGGPSFREWLGR